MKIALIQLTTRLDYRHNLQRLDFFLREVKKNKVQCVFLPECFYSLSDGQFPTPHLLEEENCAHLERICQIAKKYDVYLVGGSAATKSKSGDILNRAYQIDPTGRLLHIYDKKHLFKCALPGANFDEGKIYTSGNQEKFPFELPNTPWKIGISICFDLRYPTFYHDYLKKGANVLTVASAFTKITGKAHWHTLLRARAIENQCYVVAANQWGQNNERVSTYGHSLIIDPWGEVLADATEGEKIIFADLDIKNIDDVRAKISI